MCLCLYILFDCMVYLYMSVYFKEVAFDVSYDKDTFVGDNLELCVKITNNGSAERKVDGKLTLQSMFYTGLPHKIIKRMSLGEKIIGPGAGNDKITTNI